MIQSHAQFTRPLILKTHSRLINLDFQTLFTNFHSMFSEDSKPSDSAYDF